MSPFNMKSIKYLLFDLTVFASFVAAAFYLRGRADGHSLSAPEYHNTASDTHQPSALVEVHPQKNLQMHQHHQDVFKIEVANRNKQVEVELIERLHELIRLVDPVIDEVDEMNKRWSGALSEQSRSRELILVESFISKTMDQYDTFKGKMEEFIELDERLARSGGELEPIHRKKIDMLHDLADVVDKFKIELANRNKKIEVELIERLHELIRLVDPVLAEVDKMSERWSDAWSESRKLILVESFISKTMDQYDTFKGKVEEFNELDERLARSGGGLEPAHREKIDMLNDLTDVVEQWRGMASLDRIMSR